MIVELDFDGVLNNLNANVIKIASEHFKKNLKEEDMNRYDYSLYPEKIRNYIFSLFHVSELMTKKEFLYDEAIEFLKWLDKEEGFKVNLRTLVITKEIQKARTEFLEKLFSKNNIKNIRITVVTEKPEIKCDILIEDNPHAIERKKDGLVIMREHPYNRHLKETQKKNLLTFTNLSQLKEILLNIEKKTLK